MKKGFTLIEVLIATVILLIALLGLLPLFISNVKLNEEVKIRLIGRKVLEDMALAISTLSVVNLETSSQREQALSKLQFFKSFPHGGDYPNNQKIRASCPSPYDETYFRGYYVEDENHRRYYYLLKLCLDVDYLKPYLMRARLWNYWKYRGKVSKTVTDIIISAKD